MSCMTNLYRTRLDPRDLVTYKIGPGEAGQGYIEIELETPRVVSIHIKFALFV
jgi:hypothetical protein